MTRDVIVAGAGPVGLLLAARLGQLGLSVALLERRAPATGPSRAIGLHPPALERMAILGVSESLLARGVRVSTGRACCGRRELGALRFAACPPPFNFVLTIPQGDTEDVLRACVAAQPTCRMHDRTELVDHVEEAGSVVARCRGEGPQELRAHFLVGCDGKDSEVRGRSGIPVSGGPYPDRFAMGDFADGTPFGDEARIFLDDEGFIESFPLPRRMRRWVMRLREGEEACSPGDFVAAIRRRTGQALEQLAADVPSVFGVQHAMAATFARGRVALAGDAAHVMSPIGGQGMNVGWLNAWDLASALRDIVREGAPAPVRLRAYDREAQRRARVAIRRAARNMAVGGHPLGGLRNGLVRVALHLPARAALARYFTLRGV